MLLWEIQCSEQTNWVWMSAPCWIFDTKLKKYKVLQHFISPIFWSTHLVRQVVFTSLEVFLHFEIKHDLGEILRKCNLFQKRRAINHICTFYFFAKILEEPNQAKYNWSWNRIVVLVRSILIRVNRFNFNCFHFYFAVSSSNTIWLVIRSLIRFPLDFYLHDSAKEWNSKIDQGKHSLFESNIGVAFIEKIIT